MSGQNVTIIENLCDNYHIPLRHEMEHMMKKYGLDVSLPKNLGVIVYMSCKNNNIPRSYNEVISITKCTSRDIWHGIQELGITEGDIVKPSDIIYRVLPELAFKQQLLIGLVSDKVQEIIPQATPEACLGYGLTKVLGISGQEAVCQLDNRCSFREISRLKKWFQPKKKKRIKQEVKSLAVKSKYN